MLKDKIDVTAWMVDLVENYPNSITKAKSGSFSSYILR